MKVLVVGPSPKRSKGGMATVIQEIKDDIDLNNSFDITIYESYVDGNKVARFFFSIFAFIKFYLFYRKYDVYHIHMASRGSTYRKGYYIRAANSWGKKVIVHIHGAQYMDFYHSATQNKKNTINNIFKVADTVIVLSDGWKQRFDSMIGLSNCVSLPNGIDVDRFSRAICDVEKHTNEFVFLGKIGQRKGAFDLINAVEIAVKKNPQIKVYLAGDGEVDRVKKTVLSKGLDNNISVEGWVDFEGKIRLLKNSATVVLPSYDEGLPMSILEGMAAGKAIISTPVGAIPEVIKQENGILVAPGDVDSLADALLKISNDSCMLSIMSINNLNKIEDEFSMQKMHQGLAYYYKN